MRFSTSAWLLLAALILPAHADNITNPIRIGLVHDFARSTSLVVSPYGTGVTIYDARGQKITHCASGLVLQVTPSSQGLTLTRTAATGDKGTLDNDGLITIKPDNDGKTQIARLDNPNASSLAIKWHVYRGYLSIRRTSDNTLQITNTVDLEQYLYGVLPAEIGTHVPLEAMRAQAVAARTYALKNLNKCLLSGYDLDDTTHCEGYYGFSGESLLTTTAVDGTRGQVLTYKGKIIDAPYSTDSGGMTACDLSGDCPYLCAVKDAPEAGGPDYAENSNTHHWTVTYSKAQLQAAFAKNPMTRVSQFLSLAIDGIDPSGRITTATVSGTDGTMKTVTGSVLRRVLGYDVLRSTRVTLTITSASAYRFEGWGWGHGLGMSQLGAVAMASPPYEKNYQQILAHYYVGTVLAQIGTGKPPQSARRVP